MPSAADPKVAERYPRSVALLHWLIAALILVLIALGWFMADIPKGTPARAYYFNLHK